MFDFFTKDQWLAILIAIPYGLTGNWVQLVSIKLPKILLVKICRFPITYFFASMLISGTVLSAWCLSVLLFKPLVDDWQLFGITWAFSWMIMGICVKLFLYWKYKR